MRDIINPDEIKSITSKMPITITFSDGSTVMAHGFYFKDLTHHTSSENDEHKVTRGLVEGWKFWREQN